MLYFWNCTQTLISALILICIPEISHSSIPLRRFTSEDVSQFKTTFFLQVSLHLNEAVLEQGVALEDPPAFSL
jgi:hypothetical protein